MPVGMEHCRKSRCHIGANRVFFFCFNDLTYHDHTIKDDLQWNSLRYNPAFLAAFFYSEHLSNSFEITSWAAVPFAQHSGPVKITQSGFLIC